jgi:chaperone BCS1
MVEADIDYFLNHRNDYERTGKPWTYTILNTGPPGVGKTKLVKAIAAKTGYTLIVINLVHIRNIQTLYDAFHSPYLNGEAVPHDKRLYYIPEVDTQMMDVLQARVATVVPVGAEQAKPESGKDAFKVTTEQPKKPTLGQILNILDGVPERYGHILVMDTNHLEKLDPALIRPGRVDRIVSWNKLSAASVRAYIQNYYMVELPKTVILPDRAVTAAELQSYVCRNATWPALVGTLLPQTVTQTTSCRMNTRSKKIEQSVCV